VPSRWSTLGILAATFAVPATSNAEPPGVGSLIVSDSGASCPASAQLEARVDQLLGAPGATRARMQAAGIGASVRFADAPGSQRADIELHGARSGQRTLSDDGADCRELAEAAALTLAILIDPSFVPPSDSRSTGGTAPPVPGEPATPAPPTPSPAAPPGAIAFSNLRAPLPRAERPPGSTPLSLMAGGGVASRLTRPILPALAGGAALDFSRRIGLRALALWIPPSAVDISPGSVELTLLVGSLEACVHFPPPNPGFRVSACGGASAGAIEANGQGYTLEGSERPAFFALQAGFSGDLPLSEPLGVWLDGRGYYSFTQYEFEVTDVGSVKPTKNPGFSALVGLRLRLF
jgi:hypothetical protein